jgi:diamine N-acetyltransferase
VELQPITRHNVAEVFALELAPGQERFVAPNPWSLAQALAQYDTAWPRAITVDGNVVGFLMLEIDPHEPSGRPFWLWRLMIGKDHQGRGYGRDALRLACAEVRRRGATDLFTSWVPGEGSPETFYLEFGFVPTGEIDDGEVVARLDLTIASYGYRT